MAISSGTQVWLKYIEGPAMLAENEQFPGQWKCVWFEGKKLRSDLFRIELLTEEKPVQEKDVIDVTLNID